MFAQERERVCVKERVRKETNGLIPIAVNHFTGVQPVRMLREKEREFVKERRKNVK